MELVALLGLFALTGPGCVEADTPRAAAPRAKAPSPRGNTATPTPTPGPGSWVELELGHDWGCARDDRGGVWCWGEDPTRAEGSKPASDDGLTARRVETPAPARSLSAHDGSLCATFERLPARCWKPSGDFDEFPRTEGVAEFVRSRQATCWRGEDGRAVCLAASEEHDGTTRHEFANAIGLAPDCVLLRGGETQCFRRRGKKPAPPTTTLEPGPRGPTDARAIVDEDWLFFLTEGGQLLRADKHGALTAASLAGPATAYVAARYHSCALLEDGRVQCVGSNQWGELGLGDTRDRDQPTLVPTLAGATAIAVGEDRTCAATPTTITCWGRVKLPVDDPPAPLPIDARAVYAWEDTSCAEDQQGALWCWGQPMGGGLLGQATPREVQPPLGIGPIASVSGGLGEICFVDERLRMVCGELTSPPDAAAPATLNDPTRYRDRLSRWRFLYHGCDLRRRGRSARVECTDVIGTPALKNPTELYDVGWDPCVIHNGGEVLCWEIVANRDDDGAFAHDEITLPDVRDAIALTYGPCVLQQSGRVRCRDGALDVTDAIDIAHDQGSTLCVLTRAGAVLCREGTGPLRRVDIPPAHDLTAGLGHHCAALRGGGVQCWGDNERGELGRLPPELALAPVTIRVEDP